MSKQEEIATEGGGGSNCEDREGSGQSKGKIKVEVFNRQQSISSIDTSLHAPTLLTLGMFERCEVVM